MKRRPARQPPADERPPLISEPITRRELALLAVILVWGAALRLWAFSLSAVEHFDEGVYASNIYFEAPEYAYPLQRFYAPPLLPALIETGMIVGLPPNVAAILPSFLAGCGTIVAMWWFGRSWFGPPVGVAAATLVALSDFHVLYSATALTDVLLGLWLVLAVDAAGRSIVGRPTSSGSRSLADASGWYVDYRWAVGAGIFTGLAWWTKYNGWLPLAIEGAAMPVLWLLLRPGAKQVVAWFTCFAVTGLVAIAVWSPYYLSLQSTGGYGPIAANHAKYVVGFAGWLDSAGRQMANQYAFGIWITLLGLLLAVALPHFLEPRGGGELLRQIWKSVQTAIAFVVVTGLNVLALGAALGIVRMVIAHSHEAEAGAARRRNAVGLSLVIAWWTGMALATPLYTPYARLALPCWMAACLASSLNWSPSVRVAVDRPWAGATVRMALLPLFVCGWLAPALISILPHRDVWKLPKDRRGIQNIASAIRRLAEPREARAVYVYGEPALFFQLRVAGEEIVAPAQTIPAAAASLDGRAIPTFLAVGLHSQRDPKFQEQWAAAKASGNWEWAGSYEYQPSALDWLDLHDPRQPIPKDAGERNQVVLYRLK